MKYGHTYTISSFTYKTTVYNGKKNYDMMLNDSTEITETGTLEFTGMFTSLDEIRNQKVVDVLVILIAVAGIDEINQKGSSWKERTITVSDGQGQFIGVKLYNLNAVKFNYKPGTILAIRRADVQQFAGCVNLKISSSTLVQSNPDIEGSEDLLSWYNEQDGVFPDYLEMCDLIPMGDIASAVNSCTTSQFRFKCNAAIYEIHTDVICYDACRTCKKKLAALDDGGLFCQKCQKRQTESELHYILTLIIEDDEHAFQMVAFNNVVEKLFDKSAQEMMDLKINNSEAFFDIIGKVTGIKYQFVCVARKESTRPVQYQIISYSTID